MIDKLLGNLYWDEFESILKDVAETCNVDETKFFYSNNLSLNPFFVSFLKFHIHRQERAEIQWRGFSRVNFTRNATYTFSLQEIVQKSNDQAVLSEFKNLLIDNIIFLTVHDTFPTGPRQRKDLKALEEWPDKIKFQLNTELNLNILFEQTLRCHKESLDRAKSLAANRSGT